jgi:hypothetical protein
MDDRLGRRSSPTIQYTKIESIMSNDTSSQLPVRCVRFPFRFGIAILTVATVLMAWLWNEPLRLLVTGEIFTRPYALYSLKEGTSVKPFATAAGDFSIISLLILFLVVFPVLGLVRFLTVGTTSEARIFVGMGLVLGCFPLSGIVTGILLAVRLLRIRESELAQFGLICMVILTLFAGLVGWRILSVQRPED